MRITDSMRFNTMVNNLNNTQSDYNEISEQIATQKKVNRASDDPVCGYPDHRYPAGQSRH